MNLWWTHKQSSHEVKLEVMPRPKSMDSDLQRLIQVLLLPNIQSTSNRDQCLVDKIWHHTLRRPAAHSISSGPLWDPLVIMSPSYFTYGFAFSAYRASATTIIQKPMECLIYYHVIPYNRSDHGALFLAKEMLERTLYHAIYCLLHFLH